jgi:hypothetical protein
MKFYELYEDSTDGWLTIVITSSLTLRPAIGEPGAKNRIYFF